MKPFEELYTAWIDGELTEEDRADFERQLQERGEETDHATAQRELAGLRSFLRENLTVPALVGQDFFNHGIVEQIRSGKADLEKPRPRFRIPRLVWLGSFSMAAALVLFLAIIPKKSETHSQSAYIAQIISARSADPTISATAFQTRPQQADDLTVVWLDGLDYVPGNAQ